MKTHLRFRRILSRSGLCVAALVLGSAVLAQNFPPDSLHAMSDPGSGPAHGGALHLAQQSTCTPSAAPLGNGLNFGVRSLAVFDDGGGTALYAGGFFAFAGGVPALRIAKWDGSSWSALGSGVNEVVLALTAFDDGGGAALYAGGWFSTAGGVTASRIAKWDGSGWGALESGMTSFISDPPLFPTVEALAVFDDGGGAALYAGGDFTFAGGVQANNIAKWNGSSWAGLPNGPGSPGMSDVVCAMAVFDDGSGAALYAGGVFTVAGGTSANRIAKWDGSSWSALSSGLNKDVLAMTVFDDGGGDALYVGGKFTAAGGQTARRIAKWDGSSWSELGLGMVGSENMANVHALTVFDDGGGEALYAGGVFTSAGGGVTNQIAKWDGSSWSPLGTGTNGWVLALTVFDDGGGASLHAGGGFTIANGVAANFIAKWSCELDPLPSFCDASDNALASCPCSNPGQPDTGCDTPIPAMQGGGLTGGVRLDFVSQTCPPNRATLTGTGYPTGSTPSAIVIRSDSLQSGAPVVFGDGLRCIGVPTVRLGAATAVGGVSTHTFGHGTAIGAGPFYYQIWFRSEPSSYCGPDAFNLTNGRVITW